MLENYLLAWLRTLLHHKSSTLISVVSLALGLACAVFIVTFIRDELSYDRWIPGSEDLYRVEVTVTPPGSSPIVTPSAPFALSDAMKAELPEVKDATPLVPGHFTVSVADKKFFETINFVDPHFFRIVQLPLIEGDPEDVLIKPESAVISQSMARKLFGANSPMNRTLLLNRTHTVLVTGVMNDLPYNTQFTDDIYASNRSPAFPFPEKSRQDWMAFVKYVYVQLAPGADSGRVEAKILDLFSRHLNPGMLSSMRLRAEELITVRLKRFQDAHLSSDRYVSGNTGGSWATIYGFAVIAIVILAIACSNFATLATAQSTTRAREVAMRKVLGASRSQLTFQFLFESSLLTAIAFAIAMALVAVFFPFFISIIGHDTDLLSWRLLLTIVGVTVLTGLFAGMYPALVLSRFSPSVTLKSGVSPRIGNRQLRSVLVIIQFAVSIALAVTTVVMFSQIRHVQTLNLGFRHDNVVIVDTSIDPGINDSTRETYIHSLLKHPAIVAAAQSATVPFEPNDSRGSVWIPGNPNQFFARHLRISADFPELYGMRLLAGRLLSTEYGQDVTTPQRNSVADDGRNVMISASAAAMFSFSPEDAIGKVIQVGDQARVHIVGVLEDALFQGAEEGAIPTIFFCNTTDLRKISIRIKGEEISAGLQAIDEAWRMLLPNTTIYRHFLHEDFQRLFAEHEKRGLMFAVFASLTVVVACLGLFGLAAFSVQRDTKAIGMRRVLGASRAMIVRWQVARFSALILLACLFAWPVAAYFLHHWLEGFEHRIELNPMAFLCVGLGALGVAWVTIIWHILYAARLKPIDTLRYE